MVSPQGQCHVVSFPAANLCPCSWEHRTRFCCFPLVLFFPLCSCLQLTFSGLAHRALLSSSLPRGSDADHCTEEFALSALLFSPTVRYTQLSLSLSLSLALSCSPYIPMSLPPTQSLSFLWYLTPTEVCRKDLLLSYSLCPPQTFRTLLYFSKG